MQLSDKFLSECSRGSGLIGLLLAALFVSILLGCGSAPVQEMSEARQAIEAARVAGAEEFAARPYLKSQAHLRAAEEMLDNRHFNKARENAALARDEAILARETAQNRK